MVDYKANLIIDVYRDGKFSEQIEKNNVLCNTGRLFAVRRLVGEIAGITYNPINVFVAGDQGTADPSDADSLPLTPEPIQVSINHEVIRTEIDYDGCSSSPVDPNASDDPISLTVNGTISSKDVDPGLVYVGRVSEAGLVCATPSDATYDHSSPDDYVLVTYTTFKAIPFAIAENVVFSISWNVFCSRG